MSIYKLIKKSWSSHFTQIFVIIICGFVSISIGYLYLFRVRCRVLFSDWSISKMNITNLALDQSEWSTESWRSVILIFDLRLHGRTHHPSFFRGVKFKFDELEWNFLWALLDPYEPQKGCQTNVSRREFFGHFSPSFEPALALKLAKFGYTLRLNIPLIFFPHRLLASVA